MIVLGFHSYRQLTWTKHAKSAFMHIYTNFITQHPKKNANAKTIGKTSKKIVLV